MFTRFISLLMIAICMSCASTAFAQNTSGVSSPVVKEGDKSLQYRVGIDPETSSGDAAYAQRVHYQQSINGDLRWRMIAQARGTDLWDLNLDYIQAELLWELTDDDDKHRSGFRFEARIRDGDRAEQFGLKWTNLFNFESGWSARAILYPTVQIGDNAADGINLQTRGRLSKKLDQGMTLGVDMFNNYGNTNSLGNFNDQRHTIGPFISLPVNDKFSVLAGTLFGFSDAAPDTELRLWITRKL